MSRRPRFGVVLQPVDPPERFEAMVGRIDALGFDHLWLTDSSLHAGDPYAYLALAARRSPRLLLGTAVTNPLTRHPAVTAVAAATADAISQGRTILGIGAGDRPLQALGLRPAPLEVVRATVLTLRRLWAGERVDAGLGPWRVTDGHLRIPARVDLPVFISASGPRTLELAGEIADGVIVLAGLFTEGIAFALHHIEQGAERAGRPRPHVAVFAYGAIDEDEDHAVTLARPIAAWFPQTAPRYCELAGLDPAIAAEVRTRYGGGEFQEAQAAAELLPVAFVRKMALAGNRARAVATIAPLLELGVDSVHVFPLGGEERMATVEAFATCRDELVGEAAR